MTSQHTTSRWRECQLDPEESEEMKMTLVVEGALNVHAYPSRYGLGPRGVLPLPLA
jgi:hypothetical protein